MNVIAEQLAEALRECASIMEFGASPRMRAAAEERARQALAAYEAQKKGGAA